MKKLNDKRLKFFPKSHKYKVEGKELTSVTTFIGRLFEPFNQREIARKLAKFPINKQKKHGVRWFLAEWEKNRSEGTLIHKELEEHLYNTLKRKEKTINPKTLGGVAWLHEYLRKVEEPICFPEVRIYSEELGLAGTVDVVVSHVNTEENRSNRVVSLIDWKTNKEITTKGYKGKTGIHPFTKNMDDCHINRYGLQLGLYAYILEKEYDLVIDKLILVHLKEKGSVSFVVQYKRELIEKILESEKNGKD